MKKFLVVIVIVGLAAFIYYSQQNFFQKNRLRRNWEDKIEDITGLDDVNLKDTLKGLEDLQDMGRDILGDRDFQRAVQNLSDDAKEQLQELSERDLEKLKEELKEGAQDYKEILEDYLGD